MGKAKIFDHLRRSWIDENLHGRAREERSQIIREYEVELQKGDRITGTDANYMEFSVRRKIQERGTGEKFSRLWPEQTKTGEVWVYTTTAGTELDHQRFIREKYRKFLNGEETKLSPDMLDIFSKWAQEGLTPERVGQLSLFKD